MLFRLVDLLFQIYMIMLLIRIFGSWFPDFSYTRFMQFISFYTDPYLNIFRRFIPPFGMLDISPIFAFIFLNIMEKVVKSLLFSLIL